MKFFNQVTIFIFAFVWWEKVKCLPRHKVKGIEKKFHFELRPLPLEYVAFMLEKATPLKKYTVKHVIHKRQISQTLLPPMTNEIPASDLLPESQIIEKKEDENIPEVIITSIIKPFENSKSFSFMLPEQSEVLITPAEKPEVLMESAPGLLIPKVEEVVSPPEKVVEITPKPVIIPPPPPLVPVPQPVVQNVAINSPLESAVPFRVPLFPNLNKPISNPLVNIIPNSQLLYTDITKIPFSATPYPTPVPAPVSDFIIPPLSPPPPPVQEPPVVVQEPPVVVKEPPIIKETTIVKEPTPNFFVKGSRFVLYFGSMMLQMLSQLVNGQINLNQPLPAVFPGL